MKRFKVVAVAIVGFMLASCAFTPKELELTAKPTITDDKVGHDTALYFKFVDDRDDMIVGVRGANNMGSKITAANLAEYVERELRAGLQVKGYELTDNRQDAVAEITYRLRAFKFSINMGFWTGAENKAAIISVNARKASDEYDQTYRYSDVNRKMFVTGGNTIDAEMNAALAAVLNEALNDGHLDVFLVK